MSRRKQAEREAALEMKRRRLLLLERKERRERRTTMAIFLPVLALVLAFIGFGFYREGYWRPRQPVARVSGEAIRADDYGKRVQFARRQMLSSLNSFAGLLQSSDPSLLTDIATRQRSGVAQDVLDEMIDDQIVLLEAERLEITVTDDEVDARIREDLAETLEGPAPVETEDEASEEAESEDSAESDGSDSGDTESEASEDADGDSVDTESEASEDADGDSVDTGSEEGSESADDSDSEDAAAEDDGPSDAEIERAFERILQPQLDDAGMNRSDYEELVRIRLYREKLNEKLGEDIARTGAQVEADYLLFTDESVAAMVEADLTSGMSWDEAVEKYQRPEEEVVDDADEGPDSDAEGEADAAADEEEAAEEGAEEGADEADEEADEASDSTEEDTEATDDESGAAEDDAEDGADSDEDDSAAEDEDADAAADASEDGEGDASDDGSEEAGDEGEDAAEGDVEEGDEEEASEEAPSPTPAPTATPEPYAYEIGESKWYTLESLEERLVIEKLDAESVFGLRAGETSFAIEGNRGTYIIRVTDSEADREIDEAELQPELDGALDAWLENQRVTLSSEIDRFPAEAFIPAEPPWFVTGFSQIVGTLGSAPPITVPDTSGGAGTQDGG